MSENLFSMIAARCADDDAVFIRHPDGTTLSYRQAFARAARFANVLAGLGVVAGDRVAVQIEKSADALLLYLGCLRAGAVFLPLNTGYTGPELTYFLGDAEPRVFVVDPAAEAKAEAVCHDAGVAHPATLGTDGNGKLAEAAAGAAEDFAEVPRTSDDLAAILYTSGTTGRSKGAMLSHGNLQTNAEVLHDYWQWQDADDVLLHALPIFHVHGLFVALHCALLGTSPVHFLPRFDVDAILARLPESTVMMGVPTFYTRLLDSQSFTAEACRNMRLFISGSAPLLAETHREFEARTGHRILERYGMTETGMITSNPYHGERVAGSVGFALPGISVRIADDQGRELPRGETGVLEMTGPNVFKGYWQMPEKTAAEFRPDGWFITGDMAVMDGQDRISIVGRAKDLIISGGYNVYPKEIEGEIDAIPGVKESAVIGLPHPDFGEGVAAVVVPDGSRELSEADILDPLKDHLARFKQPKRVFMAAELPRNTMGKVQKAQLREAYKDTFNS
jgi:malonyl-CoA/methylmalonyl-CoA synthetase